VQSTPLASRNGPVTCSAADRARSHRAQERRRALIVSSGILLVVALGFVLAMTAKLPMSSPPVNLPQAASEVANHSLNSAKVTIHSGDANGCRQQVFDNQTGRMTRTQQPCDSTTRDSNGAPVPLGTIHRLDAISKSFSDH
jgi:hypothetical protein